MLTSMLMKLEDCWEIGLLNCKPLVVLLFMLPYRGGNWNNGDDAGLFALNLNNPRSNSNTNIGFRPDCTAF